MKPQKLYFATDLLDYFVGTSGPHIWQDRGQILEFLRGISEEKIFGRIPVCEITDYPYSETVSNSQMIQEFVIKALEEFGTCDYELDPLSPSGGWKTLKIIC